MVLPAKYSLGLSGASAAVRARWRVPVALMELLTDWLLEVSAG